LRELVVGVDLGATKVLTGIATIQGNLLSKVKFSTDCKQKNATEILDNISNSIDKIIKDNVTIRDRISGIIVATPGPLKYPEAIVMDSPNLGWGQVFLKEELSQRLGRPVIVDKDTNIAALGEYYFGQGCQYSQLLYITISTGIGGGIIINGRIHHGSNGGAGEFGHMVIKPDGPICRCGRRGCLEALASGTAIAREAVQLIKQEKGQGILACSKGKKIEAREVGEAARKGDIKARTIILDAAEYIGIGVANLVNIFNPQIVVLGGGVAVGLEDLLLEPVREHVYKNVFALHKQNLKIEVSKLGNAVGLWGCIAVAARG
jgi:glucokinase